MVVSFCSIVTIRSMRLKTMSEEIVNLYDFMQTLKEMIEQAEREIEVLAYIHHVKLEKKKVKNVPIGEILP